MSLLNAQFAFHCCKKLYSEKINKRGQGWPIFKKKYAYFFSVANCSPCAKNKEQVFMTCIKSYPDPKDIFKCADDALQCVEECRPCICEVLKLNGVPC